MTTATAPRPRTAPTDATRVLRSVLLVDGAGTAALGVVALLAAEPLAEQVGSPGLLRAVGVLFLVVGADMLLARRLRGTGLRRAAVALGVADLAFAAAVLVGLALGGATAGGAALVVGVAAVCVGMGAAKLALARRLSR